MEKILIIGGAGFIGYQLFIKAKEKGYKPYIFDNLSNPSSLYKKEPNLIKGDISKDYDLLKKTIVEIKPRFVVHLAAMHYIPDCINDSQKTFKTNVIGTQNVISAMENLDFESFLLFSSTAAVYTDTNKPCSERTETTPVDIYGHTKLISEMNIKYHSNQSGLQYLIFRFFNVYGDGDNTPHLIPKIIEQIKSGSRIKLGNIDSLRDYVHVQDVVFALLKAFKNIEEIKNDTFNIGTGNAYSAKTILKVLNQKNFIVSNELIRKDDRKKLIANINKIKNDLGWTPQIDFEKGIKELLK